MIPRNWFFLERMLQWILIFFIHFCFKIWCIVKFRFTFWRVLKRLIRNLTRFKKFYSKIDELLEFGSKSDTFWYFWFKIWGFVENWINLNFSKNLGSKYVFFYSCHLRIMLFKRARTRYFRRFSVLKLPENWFFEQKFHH